MATITGTAGDDRSENSLVGGPDDDLILGLEGRDNLTGLEGNDTLDGGAGDRDAARYLNSPSPIVGNLTTNTVSDGYGGTDTLIDIEDIRGSEGNDTLIGGTEGETYLYGNGGDDVLTANNTSTTGGTILNGGNGNDTLTNIGGEWSFMEPGAGTDLITGADNSYDIVSYFFSAGYDVPLATQGVTVTFTDEGVGTVTDYSGSIDSFTSIERVEGTMFADVMTGAAGYQSFEGRGGNDTIDGGEGFDEVSYRGTRDDFAEQGGVVVDLAAGTATDTFGDTDTLINIEGVRGTELGDRLTGNDEYNDLRGEGGDDTLTGGGGDDRIRGDNGTDTAIYEGNQSNYTLTLSANETRITDRRADGEGSDELLSVERLDFETEVALLGDGPMDLDRFDDAVTLSSDDFASIAELYIAYFNRAPDAIGLNFWASAFARGEVDLPGMAELFFDQAETRTAYAASLNEGGTEITDVPAFVTAVYTNVLGRPFDQAGLDFWAGVLQRGDVTPGAFIGEIIRGAKADPAPGASQAFIDQQLADRQYLDDKIDIGIHFSVINGMSDTTNAATVMDLFTGTQESIDAAVALSNQLLSEAQSADGAEFLMQLVGVIDDPFAGV